MISIKQLAELLNVSTDTIRGAARSGLIPSTREGTASRFDWPKVRQAMEKRAKEANYKRPGVFLLLNQKNVAAFYLM
ncbi:excisionase family DNA-binding protein [Petrachloros mirabilis]